MTVIELIEVLAQYPPALPVVVFNSEGDEILKIPDYIPDVVVGTQTVNNKEINVILCSRKMTKELKESVKVRKNNPNGGNGSSKDCAGKAGREPIHHTGFGSAGKKKRRGQKGKS